jgi:para-nitrobenzyl esterase
MTLMAMPSAAGLFHRAAVHSAGYFHIPGGEEMKDFTRQVIKQLGIQPKDIGALQKMEWSQLNAAANAASAAMGPPKVRNLTNMFASVHRHFWMPTMDGRVIPMGPFQDAAPEISKDVPMLVGSVTEEGNAMRSKPTEAEWLATLTRQFGQAKATALIAAMKKAHPEKSIPTLSYGVSGLDARNNVLYAAKLKYDLHAAPAYQFLFQWQSPMLEGAGAWHTAELAFCFDNTLRCAQGTGNTPEAQALAKKMATAWANFARTGNPSQPGLTWDPSDPVRNQTMVFDNQCRMEDNPENEARKILVG